MDGRPTWERREGSVGAERPGDGGEFLGEPAFLPDQVSHQLLQRRFVGLGALFGRQAGCGEPGDEVVYGLLGPDLLSLAELTWVMTLNNLGAVSTICCGTM